MHEQLGVALAGNGFVGNPRLHVTQFHAIVPGSRVSKKPKKALMLAALHLNFFSSLDCTDAVRAAACCALLNRRRSDRSSTEARCKHK
jgi:hypothetical protein